MNRSVARASMVGVFGSLALAACRAALPAAVPVVERGAEDAGRVPDPTDAGTLPSVQVAWRWSLRTVPLYSSDNVPRTDLEFSPDDRELYVAWSAPLAIRLESGDATGDGRHAHVTLKWAPEPFYDRPSMWVPASASDGSYSATLYTEIVDGPSHRVRDLLSGEYVEIPREQYKTTLRLEERDLEPRERSFRVWENYQGVYAFGKHDDERLPGLALWRYRNGAPARMNQDVVYVDARLRGDAVLTKSVRKVVPQTDGRIAFVTTSDVIEFWSPHAGRPFKSLVLKSDKSQYAPCPSHDGQFLAYLPLPPPEDGDVPVLVRRLDGTEPPRAVAWLPRKGRGLANKRWDYAPAGTKGRRASFLGVEADVVASSVKEYKGRAQGMCCNAPLHPKCPAGWNDDTTVYCFDDTAAPTVLPGADVHLRCAPETEGVAGEAPWAGCDIP